ncbi:MAG: DNA-directed RNA polymerase subunit beta [Methylacidiphilales bacterium]|nr:DNA-directed RNA polymerase subunit beta [Candidatus Methylacidiphilales bacterium]
MQSISHTEKKRIRKFFGVHTNISSDQQIQTKLLDIQLHSYKFFLEKRAENGVEISSGIERVLSAFFPLKSHSGNIQIEYVSSKLKPPLFNVREAIIRNVSYVSQLVVTVRVVMYQKQKDNETRKKVKEISQHEIYLAEIPLMTEYGTFVVNGVEKVLVSQLHRSPGVLFDHDEGKTHTSGKLLYLARIIPYRGSWLDFEFDTKDCLYIRIDRKRKIPATVLLKALEYDEESILKLFYTCVDILHTDGIGYTIEFNPELFLNELAPFDIMLNKSIVVSKGKRITEKHIQELADAKVKFISLPEHWLYQKRLSKPMYDRKTGEILHHINTPVTSELLSDLIKHSIDKFPIILTNEIDRGPYIAQTLDIDKCNSTTDALTELFRLMRPGEPVTQDVLNDFFKNLFFQPARYDLSDVGRMKFNLRMKRKDLTGPTVLTKEDIVDTMRVLINIRDGRDEVDDIDNLGNRRIRTAGEMIENQFRIGLVRLERSVMDRLSQYENDEAEYHEIINSKPVTYALKEFFNKSPLCQFMDQINPLSEVTHKRRISALGPGGLARDRAGFEVRDVHPTHYGRICPIETPEGPNIGLINSLAMYSKINRYGFLITPYFRVDKGIVSKHVVYLSAIEESNFIIAQARTPVDSNGKLTSELVTCRYKNEFLLISCDQVQYIDVSPSQIVSVAAALIPFLEHDDANRALMGSNMQRQAVPLLRPEKPLVGTGLEKIVAIDSGATVVAKRSGVVDRVESNRVVVRVNEDEIEKHKIQSGVDIYNLVKYTRSNQNMCINQKPIVKIGEKVHAGDVLADGQCSDLGELALGQNMLVAFMPWNGYNFEDSILISERVVKEDRFTSIHIEELECIARDTKLGKEEITSDIPNVSEHLLNKLDDSGVIYIGSEVKPNDILVGMVTPKGEIQQSPEEKLLRAIFAEKATEVKDSSLRAPQGMEGVVVDVRVFTREGIPKDSRALSIEKEEVAKLKKNIDDEVRIQKEDIIKRVKLVVKGHKLQHSLGSCKSGVVLDDNLLNQFSSDEIFEIRIKDPTVADKLEILSSQADDLNKKYKKMFDEMKANITRHDDLPPNVLKMVKVFIAVKRRLQPGDKMAGRHGNKGVISMVVPVEDMPFLEDGTPVDIVLNPLGVPSRMNIGQVLETHLGWASKALGNQLAKLLEKNATQIECKEFLNLVYGSSDPTVNKFKNFSEHDFTQLVNNLIGGIPFATPVFNGASEEDIKKMLTLAKLPTSGKVTLYDGVTGDKFLNPVTIGYMYMLKLNHLVDEKMHARSTGPYSLVTQQPLGGKAQFGGQRFGEMEVWALQAYGAAHTLHELLTYKSDDISGRNRVYKNIIEGGQSFESEVPESFNVLIKEIRSIALDIKVHEMEK